MKSSSLRALVLVTTLSGLVGCARPIPVSNTHAATAGGESPASSSVDAASRAEPAIVEIYEYRHSPTVSITAWGPEENAYGLRARLWRDGSLVRDHRFYVSTFYAGGVSTFYTGGAAANVGRRGRRRNFVQTVAPAGQLLELIGTSRDIYHCSGWPNCSPYETRGVRVPDSVLRANRDSLAVRFYDRVGAELIVTVHRDVIDPYLKSVDSVSAALRKK